jgi:uncharacterized membrane protein YgcG
MFDWQIALALELLAIILGFFLWFKAAKAEAGPRKLAKIVAVLIIILATLLIGCTLAKAIISYSEYKAAEAYGPCAGEWAGKGPCPTCGGEHGKGPCTGAGVGPGSGMGKGSGGGKGSGMGKGRGLGSGTGGKGSSPRPKPTPSTAEAGGE